MPSHLTPGSRKLGLRGRRHDDILPLQMGLPPFMMHVFLVYFTAAFERG
jgi:hypothetical protein